jgi:hypothetical protein
MISDFVFLTRALARVRSPAFLNIDILTLIFRRRGDAARGGVVVVAVEEEEEEEEEDGRDGEGVCDAGDVPNKTLVAV